MTFDPELMRDRKLSFRRQRRLSESKAARKVVERLRGNPCDRAYGRRIEFDPFSPRLTDEKHGVKIGDVGLESTRTMRNHPGNRFCEAMVVRGPTKTLAVLMFFGLFLSSMQPTTKKPSLLNRYTSLPIALDVLCRKRITLLSPDTWEDRNDAYYLERYRMEMKFRSVLAICFSDRREAFHHWRVFSHGSSGVCLEFDKEKLLQTFANKTGFRSQKVTYLWVEEVEKKKPQIAMRPFIKRKPFDDEGEFRIIYESNTERTRAKQVHIDLAVVRKVTLSPWLPDSVADSVTSIIQRIDGCGRILVNRSSLIDNSGWRKAID